MTTGRVPAVLAWLATLALLASAVCGSAAGPPDRGYVSVAVGGIFTCDVPAGWGRTEDSSGVTLEGPWAGETPVTIDIRHYADGNPLYKSADQYLGMFSRPVLGALVGNDRYGTVDAAKVAGRSARVFERLKHEYLPLDRGIGAAGLPDGKDGKVYEGREMMARPVPVRERFVVVPAKDGFYALRYSAPAESFHEFLETFGKVTASFVANR